MKSKILLWLMAGVLIFSFLLSGCNEEEMEKTESPKTESQQTEIREEDTEESEETMMKVQIKDQFFTAELEKNPGAEAFAELLKEGPVTIQMNDYAGFEKVGSLGKSLPTQNRQTTTQPGDIVLYNGDQIVVFYGSNSWSYTRLARIQDLTGWEKALGNGSVEVTFSAE